jgi:hypothetical protein
VSYSPQFRTALLLSGNGTGGAYHAGVLRALREAGVKIDVVCGRGVGVVGALFAAVDAAPRTWEEGGLWRRPQRVVLYRWRAALQRAVILALAAVAILCVPLLVLATGLIAYPLSFLVQMINVDAGYRMAAAYAGFVRDAFAPGALPTVVPRLLTLCLVGAFGVLAVSAARTRREAAAIGPARAHRTPGHWWARLIGAPWTIEPGLEHFRSQLWHLFRGPVAASAPPASDLSRRYAELLLDNLGQPGFRELIVATADLETRCDLIFAALRDDRRLPYFQRGHGDLVDVGGIGRTQILQALAGALSIPLVTDPQLVAFSPESYWKGETHRVCDRIGAVPRLLDELAAAAVEQVILVCPDADRSAPHRLTKLNGTFEARLAEHLAAQETSAVRDAVASHRKRFKGVFLIQPAHNPIGPFDYGGAYDERSDRVQSLGELVDRGYEDAYRQFIDPIVGGGD